MTRFLFILCILAPLCLAQTLNVNTMSATTARVTTTTIGTNASTAVTVSEDFTSSDGDSLGNDSNGNAWTEAEGDTDIASNEAVQQSAAASCLNICGTSLSTTTTYVRANEDSGSQYPLVVVRYTDASSPYYAIEFNATDGQITWIRYASVGGASANVQQTGTGLWSGGSPVVWAVTIIGTGNDTIVRVWKDPTNNTPAAVDGWDTGGDTADWSFTDNPASPVDSGAKCGFGGYQNDAATLNWDDFYAGDL